MNPPIDLDTGAPTLSAISGRESGVLGDLQGAAFALGSVGAVERVAAGGERQREGSAEPLGQVLLLAQDLISLQHLEFRDRAGAVVGDLELDLSGRRGRRRGLASGVGELERQRPSGASVAVARRATAGGTGAKRRDNACDDQRSPHGQAVDSAVLGAERTSARSGRRRLRSGHTTYSAIGTA